MSSFNIQSPHVTNAAPPPKLSLAHPQTANSDPNRKTGVGKITIPVGPLINYVPKHFLPSGVLRAALDQIRIHEVTASLSHEGETNTFEQQVKIDGRRLIKSTTTPATLDSIAADLISRIHGLDASVQQDAILTRFGFRTDFTSDSVGFMERLVALQLIVRRGIEIRQSQPEGDLPNFLWTNPQGYNENDWDLNLNAAEAMGASTPQPKSQQEQIEALEAMQDDAATIVQPSSDNQDMLNRILTAVNAQQAAINTQSSRIDAQSSVIRTLQDQDQDNERARQRRRVGGLSNDADLQSGNMSPLRPPFTRPTPMSFGAQSNTATSTDYAKIMRQRPIDPADSATADRQPEVEIKLRDGKRVTADTVFALISNDDQADIIIPITDSAGGIAFKSSTQSTKKITKIGELDKVTNAVIHTMSAINDDIAHDLRCQFINTVSRAHQYFKEDIALTIAYWNKHFNAYHLGMKHAAVRIKLTFCREFAEDIREEIHTSRQANKQNQQQRSQLKEMNKSLRKLQDASGMAGKVPEDKAQGQPRIITTVTPAMRAAECYNWKAGSTCMVLDSNRSCVFKHVGEHGAEPSAAQDRWKQRNSKP